MNSGTFNSSNEARDALLPWILGLGLILGGLRFLWLGEWSLWIDEAFMLADARHGGDALKPLGYLLFDWFYSFSAPRPDEWHMRLPAALLGWLCVPAVYWVALPLVERRVGALAALFLALAPWQIYWAQNARYYTMVQLLGLLGVGGLLRALGRGSLAWFCFGALALAAAVATHPSALILASALALALLGCRFLSMNSSLAVGAHNRRLWWLCLAACGVAPFILFPHVGEIIQRWSERQAHGDPLHLVKSTAYWYTPMLCLGALAGCWQLVRERKHLFLLLLPCLGFLIALVATYFFRVAAQYVFVLFPFFALLAALPFRQRPAGSRAASSPWIYAGVLLLPLVLEDGLYFGVRGGDRPAWRAAYAHVMEQRQSTDLVFAMEAPVGRYYWDPVKDDLRSGGEFVFLDTWSADLPEESRRYGRPMWFIVNRDQTNDWSAAKRARFLQLLDQQCSLEADFEVPYTPRDLDVLVYLWRPDWEAARATPTGE